MKLRETASAYVDAPPETVFDILQDPAVLPDEAAPSPVGHALFRTRGDVRGAHAAPAARGERRVEVGDDDHRAWFVIRPEGRGTRVIHGASVEPEGLVQAAFARVRWREFHRTLEGELDAVKRLAESVDGADV